MSEIIGAHGKLLALRHDLRSHPDTRGSVRETYRESWFPEVPPIKQLVQSTSVSGVLRGMHLHRKQWDIWRFVAGRAVIRLYDHETGDGTFVTVVNDQGFSLAIPPGISHGFWTPSGCVLMYALTEEYDGSDEAGWYPLDGFQEGGWHWPVSKHNITISDRDLNAPRLADFAG
ncbi:MAG: dTDP-4-dehydrorhamnose 3,5-epimerase family protein [Trueperaceae bacterium]|nr:dTDP-4-dehydrorhamnose 3,5-epimerase family protein [Trueperaceae bacterium]